MGVGMHVCSCVITQTSVERLKWPFAVSKLSVLGSCVRFDDRQVKSSVRYHPWHWMSLDQVPLNIILNKILRFYKFAKFCSFHNTHTVYHGGLLYSILMWQTDEYSMKQYISLVPYPFLLFIAYCLSPVITQHFVVLQTFAHFHTSHI